MDRQNDSAPASQDLTAAPEIRHFQSVEELLGDPSIDEARIYESGKPPLVGDGSAVERRDFIKVLAGTFAAVSATAACGRLPVHKALPYVDKPEELTVGKGSYYATVCQGCPAGCGVLVKSRDGRPIKVEGNPDHPLSLGGVCAIGQGTVVGLYDGDRVRNPMIAGKDATWKDFDAKVAEALAAFGSDGKGLVLVSKAVHGPASQDIVRKFLSKFPGARHLAYEGPFGAGAIADAHGQTHGKHGVPSYDFAKAEVILSFGADFLGTWISPVAFAKAYAPGRKVAIDKKFMSKHIQVESRLTLTGSNADERVRILPSEQRQLLFALAAKLQAGVAVPEFKVSPEQQKLVDKWAKLLRDHQGTSLVVADSADVATQVAVNVINEAVSNYNATLRIDKTLATHQGSAQAEAALVDSLNKGEVTGVILLGVNPAYDSRLASKWADGIKKAKLSLAITTRHDETAALCQLVAASHHGLEAWGDAETQSGLVSVQQPLVNPLFDTRGPLDLLLQWAGEKDPAYAAIAAYWKAAVAPRAEGVTDAQLFWDKAVSDGMAEVRAIGAPIVLPSKAVKVGGPAEDAAPQPAEAAKPADIAAEASPVALAAAASAAALPEAASAVGLPAAATPVVAVALPPVVAGRFDAAAASKALQGPALTLGSGKFEVVLYAKVGLGSGEHANNPMLQELPDPISKATWANYLCISPKTAQEMGNLLSSDVVVVSSGNVSLELPVVLSPGMHDGAVAMAVGYGRPASMGRIAEGIGQNVYPFAVLADIAKVDIKPTGKKDPIAFSQTHHSYEHRDIVKETTIEAWAKNPKSGNATLEEMLHDKGTTDPRTTRTLWNRHLYPGYKWALAIDLNACTGCGACVVACNIENNVPVVGKKEVLVRREMHWLRIDRYYSEKKTYKEDEYDWDATKDDLIDLAENPEVVHMPMLCQHCDNAPCETVCPVLATVHTSEGLNAQAYNRCIGTRYCANNCPYKVRRFNWFNYPTREMEDKFDMDLVALALNPDIVKRSRGVMEKCSFCVQRIQEAKSEALRPLAEGGYNQPTNLAEVEKAEAGGKKLQPKYIRDGGVKPACMQTCPSEALVFGDINDPGSKVHKAYMDPRNYSALVEVGTQPAVSYMTKVRNSSRA